MQPDKSIMIELRTVYGIVKAYPVCDAAKEFAAIAGTKTLSAHTLQHVRALGYEIVSQQSASLTIDNVQ